MIESDDEELVPAGPWLEWHFDRFTVPDGATVIARNEHSTQAFVHGPHLGTQFHPESTIEIVAGWARNDAERLRSLGIDDGESRLEVSEERKRAARDAAFQLFDAFLARRR
jgi:GMP synthase-like glutamine amidotransferase